MALAVDLLWARDRILDRFHEQCRRIGSQKLLRRESEQSSQRRSPSSAPTEAVLEFVDECRRRGVPETLVTKHALYMVDAIQKWVSDANELHRLQEESAADDYDDALEHCLQQSNASMTSTITKPRTVRSQSPAMSTPYIGPTSQPSPASWRTPPPPTNSREEINTTVTCDVGVQASPSPPTPAVPNSPVRGVAERYGPAGHAKSRYSQIANVAVLTDRQPKLPLTVRTSRARQSAETNHSVDARLTMLKVKPNSESPAIRCAETSASLRETVQSTMERKIAHLKESSLSNVAQQKLVRATNAASSHIERQRRARAKEAENVETLRQKSSVTLGVLPRRPRSAVASRSVSSIPCEAQETIGRSSSVQRSSTCKPSANPQTEQFPSLELPSATSVPVTRKLEFGGHSKRATDLAALRLELHQRSLQNSPREASASPRPRASVGERQSVSPHWSQIAPSATTSASTVSDRSVPRSTQSVEGPSPLEHRSVEGSRSPIVAPSDHRPVIPLADGTSARNTTRNWEKALVHSRLLQPKVPILEMSSPLHTPPPRENDAMSARAARHRNWQPLGTAAASPSASQFLAAATTAIDAAHSAEVEAARIVSTSRPVTTAVWLRGRSDASTSLSTESTCQKTAANRKTHATSCSPTSPQTASTTHNLEF